MKQITNIFDDLAGKLFDVWDNWGWLAVLGLIFVMFALMLWMGK